MKHRLSDLMPVLRRSVELATETSHSASWHWAVTFDRAREDS
jgi:hypothetical protein